MIKILAADGIEKSAAEKLGALGFEVTEQHFEPEELKEQIKDYDALVVRSATKVREPIIDAALEAGRLKLIIRGGVGTDNIDVAYAKERGIDVRNTPNASSNSVAEMAVTHMFCMARHIAEAQVSMHNGAWEKKKYEGSELAGKTLGLIGMGRIGKLTAQKAAALGMTVVYTNRSGHKPENEPSQYVDLNTLLATADYISLHMPKAPEAVITAAEIARMKDGVFIVNTARGALIDTDDLLSALESGKVAAAAMDVFTEEPPQDERLAACPKLSLTPHIGASTVEAQERIGLEIISHITDVFGGAPGGA
ncbi:MAG: D-2-hydroxyacid dehydrogenase [Clostridiales Family XIII bacterium]|jgi:D-3-phosphoglycerate dehydrogenase|nr:D-2-hydroxyacid dehydrogenase [Clostridiales Family XIII bacterium]